MNTIYCVFVFLSYTFCFCVFTFNILYLTFYLFSGRINVCVSRDFFGVWQRE